MEKGIPMKMHQVSDHCFAVINEKNRVCDANSGLINLGGGVVIDTQSDLPHARQMIELFGKVWPAIPRHMVNIQEDTPKQARATRGRTSLSER
jgi:hypothetical protein